MLSCFHEVTDEFVFQLFFFEDFHIKIYFKKFFFKEAYLENFNVIPKFFISQ